MKIKALGMIEVLGYLAAIVVSDCALKAADVELLGAEKIGAGIVTVMITGEVSAVTSATEAGAEAAKKLGLLISSSVIARLYEETTLLFEKKNVEQQIEEIKFEEVKSLIVEAEAEVKVEAVLDKKEQLTAMKVEQLRRMVRSMKVKNLTKKEIKFARKEKLIEEILKYSKEEVK